MGFSRWWLLKVFSGLSLIAYSLGKICFLETPFSGKRVFFFQSLVLMGATITLWHYRILKKHHIRFEAPHQLISTIGLFRWIRHPMYFGDLWIMTGFAGIAYDKIGLFFLILGWISLGFQCKIEDVLVGNQFGEAHQQWKSRTRLLIPGFF